MKQLFTLLVLFVTYGAVAQTAEISGTVTNESTQEPLAGASVKYDRGKGVITDAAGHYRITVPEGDYELTVTNIGFKRQKIAIKVVGGKNQTINVSMPTDAYEFSEVSTVSVYKKNAAKENVSVGIVTSEQIKHTNSTDLGEALNKQSGVLIQDGQITIRGGSSYSYGVGSRTAIMQDGLSMMSADLGQGQNTMVLLNNAKQVEVVKGASSVIYGSSALNGVVNLVTDWPIEDTPTTAIDINMGVYGNTPRKYQQWWNNQLPFKGSLMVNHRRKVGSLQIVAGGSIVGDQSYIQSNGDWRAQGYWKTRKISEKVAGLTWGVDGSLMYETIDEFFIAKDADSNAYRVGAGSSSRYFRMNIDPHLTYATAKGHMYTLLMRYMNIDRIGNGTDPNAVSHQIMINNQYQYRLKHSLVLTAGAPVTVGASRSNLYDNVHPTLSAAVYAQLEYNIKWFSIQGGLRYEIQKVDQDLEKSQPVFRMGMNFEATKSTHFRASWGQAYRIPSIGERDILQNFYPGVIVVPNDTLHAEHGWSAEIGVNQVFKIGPKFVGFVDLAVYYNRFYDFTQYDFGSYNNRFGGSGKVITTDTSLLNHVYNDGIGVIRSQSNIPLNQQHLFGVQAHNIENAQVFGYEFTFGARGQIGKVGIQLSAGYNYSFGSKLPVKGDTSDHYTVGQFFRDAFTYNTKRMIDPNTAAYKHLLDYRVRHMVRIDGEIKFWRCYFGGTFSYASFPEKIPATIITAISAVSGSADAYTPYFTAHSRGDFIGDIRMGYKINRHVECGFIVKNLGNRFYELRPGKPEPIRNYTVQIRYNF
ncbi:MAG: TonB-dependent receptor [Bacteroidetes bacterium]|nr:TonB-dependent receptor [Bacteroidota bacterium]